MKEINDKKPILDPERELPAPHDMVLESGPKAEEKSDVLHTDEGGEEEPREDTGAASSGMSQTFTLPLWMLPLMAVLILFFAVGTYYRNTQNAKDTASTVPSITPTPTPALIDEPRSTWQTYTEKNGRFTLSYPSQLKISSESADRDFNGIKPKEQIEIAKVGPSSLRAPSSFGMSIIVFDTLGEVTAEKFVKNYVYSGDFGKNAAGNAFRMSDLTFTKKVLNGNKLTIVEGLQSIPGEIGPSVWVQHGSYAVWFSTVSTTDAGSTLEGILATLTFADQKSKTTHPSPRVSPKPSL